MVKTKAANNNSRYRNGDFGVQNMIRVINHYTNKKSGVPLLDKSETNEFGRRVFGVLSANPY